MEPNKNISADQRYWWRIAFELKLRQSHGNAFQTFFSDVMSSLHADDFVRVKPFGKLGDKGCDGYLLSTGQLFQCYGALNGETKQVSKLVKKMKEDFATALANLNEIMKEWHLVVNLVDGLPVEVVTTLKKLETENPDIKFGIISKEALENKFFTLPDEKIATFLGPAATPTDSKNLDVEALRQLVNELGAIDHPNVDDADLNPVPVSKLVHNALPQHWQLFIRGGWPNAPIVAAYFQRHHDPLKGGKIAGMFNKKYTSLKAQNLSPSEIMGALLEMVTGLGSVLPQHQVAAQALLTHVFENCDIFERDPLEVES